MAIRNVMAQFEQFMIYVVSVFDSFLVFSLLFALVFLLAACLRTVFGEALGKYKSRIIPVLAVGTVAIQYSPIGDAMVFLLIDMVSVLQNMLGIRFNWPMALAFIWLAGVALCLALLTMRYLWLQWELSRLPDYSDPDAIAGACAKADLRRPVRVKTTGKMGQVASWGIAQAWILVPDDFDERFTPEERHWIYLHELTHFKRRDALRYLALALWRSCFWFDPVCRKAANHIRHDFELACDNAVVGVYGADPLEYAQLIVKTAALERGMPIGFSSGFGNIGHRVGQLLGEKRAKGVLWSLCGALVMAAVLFVFAWCYSTAPAGTTFVHSRNFVKVDKSGVVREFRYECQGSYGIFGAYTDSWSTIQEVEKRDMRGPDAYRPELTARRSPKRASA